MQLESREVGGDEKFASRLCSVNSVHEGRQSLAHEPCAFMIQNIQNKQLAKPSEFCIRPFQI